jgi:hypothetical protein
LGDGDAEGKLAATVVAMSVQTRSAAYWTANAIATTALTERNGTVGGRVAANMAVAEGPTCHIPVTAAGYVLSLLVCRGCARRTPYLHVQ